MDRHLGHVRGQPEVDRQCRLEVAYRRLPEEAVVQRQQVAEADRRQQVVEADRRRPVAAACLVCCVEREEAEHQRPWHCCHERVAPELARAELAQEGYPLEVVVQVQEVHLALAEAEALLRGLAMAACNIAKHHDCQQLTTRECTSSHRRLAYHDCHNVR